MFDKFRQRNTALERLDTGDYTPDEYERWRREMRFIHSVWGEERALARTLIREILVTGDRPVSILDVGAGSGGILKMIRRMLPDRALFLTAAEMSDEALQTIRGESRATRIHAVKCDGSRLPFDIASFDHAISTLTLHHLSTDQAVAFVAEMDRVSSGRFYVVDLNRHPLAYYGYKLISPLLFQKFTREDGALSILRSFTARELLDVARRARVKNARVEHSKVNRLVLCGGGS